MGRTAVKLEGFKEFEAKLKKNVKLEDVKAVVQYHGSEMQQTAQIVCPRDTGNLAGSITLELTNGGMAAEVAPHTNYAGYVEWGTRFMDAQPYIRPAYLQQSKRFKDDLSKLCK
ncbi:MAG: HK97 gp10 family phage protein [Lachnospiraceae bacterium]|nr:HK97 gp10 family phage protein [Lachnospiraceae bacterium]